MRLPRLEDYTKNQIQQAILASPAFGLYYQRQASKDYDPSSLRSQRQKVWMQAFLASFFNTLATSQICQLWSDFSVGLIRLASMPYHHGELALFALGKLGAGELNLSSDVDLLAIYYGDLDTASQVGGEFFRQLHQSLESPTEEGFCFRLDWDLRPGGRLGSKLNTADQMEDYYGNFGESWERLALTRLRPLFGKPENLQLTISFAEKFSYRKILDYRLLDDLSLMRAKVHQSAKRQTGKIDLKLSPGGIRDLELFVHTLLIIHGGKKPSLRTSNTEQAIKNLAANQLLQKQDAEFLIRHYWQLRLLENLIQGIEDQQTHLLDPVKLAELCPQVLSMRQSYTEDLEQCDQIVSSLLGKANQQNRTLPAETSLQEEWLSVLGANEQVQSNWQEMQKIPLLSKVPEKDQAFRDSFLLHIMEELAKQPENFEQSSAFLRDFLQRIRAKTPFFRLFLQHPQLFKQLADLFSNSSYLSLLLIQRPELLDSFVLRSDEPIGRDFMESLVDRKLIGELVNGSQFLTYQHLDRLLENLSRLADGIVRDLMAHLKMEFSESSLEILTLGKWGGQELGLRSDLDFILVSQSQPSEQDIKVARRLFHRLTESYQAGSLYKIDTRLTPASQPLLTDQTSLLEYLGTQAAVWQRQAFLRSRWLNQSLDSSKIIEVCLSRTVTEADLTELARIQNELYKTAKREADLKLSPGGLVDIEFACQISFLVKGLKPESANTLSMLRQLSSEDGKWKICASELEENYQKLRKIEQLGYLVQQTSETASLANRSVVRSLARLVGLPQETLRDHWLHLLARNRLLLKQVDPRIASH